MILLNVRVLPWAVQPHLRRNFSVGYPFLQKTFGNTFRDDNPLPWDERGVQS